MEQTKNKISLNESTEATVFTEAATSHDSNELINLIKISGLTPALWRDLCFAAASNSGASASTFRNKLQQHLSAIGISFGGLFCHKQSSNCGYQNAWAWRVKIQMSTVKVKGSYFSAFLTY